MTEKRPQNLCIVREARTIFVAEMPRDGLLEGLLVRNGLLEPFPPDLGRVEIRRPVELFDAGGGDRKVNI